MDRSLSRREVREVDRLAIEQAGVNSLILMENAGRNCADAIVRFLGGAGEASKRSALAGCKIAIIAGSGNNGGDGFVIARHLFMRGASVQTFLTSPTTKFTADAAANYAILEKLRFDLRQVEPQELADLASRLKEFDLLVDAIGGTGITGALRGDTAIAVEQVNAAGRPVVAVDIPTGLDCDTGLAEGPAIKAALTITFVARKKGFDNPESQQYTGRVIVADIGIPAGQVVDVFGDK